MADSEINMPPERKAESSESTQEAAQNRLFEESSKSNGADSNSNAGRDQSQKQNQTLVDKGVLPGLSFSDDKAAPTASAGKDHSASALQEKSSGDSGTKSAGGQQGEQESAIGRDSKGRVTDVEPKPEEKHINIIDNGGAKIEYEGDSKDPSKVSFSNGGELQKKDDGSWQKTGLDNDPAIKDVADVKVDQKTGQIDVTNKDGSSVSKFPDGSQVVKNKDGLATEISSEPKLGEQITSKVFYDGKTPSMVSVGGTFNFYKNAEGKWDMTDRDGTTTKNAADNISVDRKTGAITIDWKNGATKDGAVSTEVSRNLAANTRYSDGKERHGGSLPALRR